MATTQLLMNTYKLENVDILDRTSLWKEYDITEDIMNYDYLAIDISKYIDDPDSSSDDISEKIKDLPKLETVKFKVNVNVQEFEKDLDKITADDESEYPTKDN
jgi:hypothetical protein